MSLAARVTSLPPERRAVMRMRGVNRREGWGEFQTLRTALHTMIMRLQNSFCESHT